MHHRILAGLVLSIAALAPAQAQVRASEAADEQFVRVGANQIAWQCRGAGPGTVLLIAGMGLDARTTYKNVFRRFAAEGYQICMYDRAGVGRSTPQDRARPLGALADELDGLVRARQWKDVVLVAHSFGGLVARAYAQAHPEAVKGIVFVDSVHESWYPAMQRSLSPAGWRIMESLIAWERDRNSHEDLVEAVEAMRARGAKLAMPVTVLSRGLPHTSVRQTGMDYQDVDAYNVSWDLSQFELAKVANDVRHVRMRYAAHLFDEQDPLLVLEEIGLLLKRAGAGAGR